MHRSILIGLVVVAMFFSWKMENVRAGWSDESERAYQTQEVTSAIRDQTMQQLNIANDQAVQERLEQNRR